MKVRARTAVSAGVVVALVVVGRAQSPRKPIEKPTVADLQHGERLFASSCSRCHGLDGSGGTGPPLTRPTLRRAPDDVTLLGIIAGGVPGTAMPASWILSEIEVARIGAYVRALGRRPVEPLPGSPEAGRALYTRLSCSTCHIIDGAGAAVGPDLSQIGALRGAAFLRESLLDPAAARPERSVSYEPYAYPAYVMVRVKPRGGSEILGTTINEDSFTIQVRDQNGRLHSFRKENLESLRADSTASAMPSFRTALTDREADDLVAYLMSLGVTR
jgi:putative heme-binding domain-containing protein